MSHSADLNLSDSGRDRHADAPAEPLVVAHQQKLHLWSWIKLSYLQKYTNLVNATIVIPALLRSKAKLR